MAITQSPVSLSRWRMKKQHRQTLGQSDGAKLKLILQFAVNYRIIIIVMIKMTIMTIGLWAKMMDFGVLSLNYVALP